MSLLALDSRIQYKGGFGRFTPLTDCGLFRETNVQIGQVSLLPARVSDYWIQVRARCFDLMGQVIIGPERRAYVRVCALYVLCMVNVSLSFLRRGMNSLMKD